jgi:hypothetical protein
MRKILEGLAEFQNKVYPNHREDGRMLTYDDASGEIVEVTPGSGGDWPEQTLLRMAEAEEELWDKL